MYWKNCVFPLGWFKTWECMSKNMKNWRHFHVPKSQSSYEFMKNENACPFQFNMSTPNNNKYESHVEHVQMKTKHYFHLGCAYNHWEKPSPCLQGVPMENTLLEVFWDLPKGHEHHNHVENAWSLYSPLKWYMWPSPKLVRETEELALHVDSFLAPCWFTMAPYWIPLTQRLNV